MRDGAMKTLFNGQIVEKDEVTISFEDRGYHFGDGLYEAVRIYAGKMFMFSEHFDRLERGAEKIHLGLPFTKAELAKMLEDLIEAAEVQNGLVYFQISRGIVSPRQHLIPEKGSVTPVYLGYTLPFERPVLLQETGQQATVIPDMRWLHCDIKSLSLMGNLLSLDEAVKKDYDDALLERDGVFTEASASNAWFVIDGVIYTHPDGNLILPGITKQHLLQLAKENNLIVIEEAVKVSQLADIDECFVTNSIYEIVPIVSIDGQAVGDGKPGPLTQQLLALYIASTID